MLATSTFAREVVRKVPLLALAVAPFLTACDDEFGPLDWSDAPEPAVIYSLTRPELLGKPSAYDFITLTPVRVETPGATGAWDVALAEEDGRPVLLPVGALPGAPRSVGIATILDRPFEEVTRAPRDTAQYRKDAPVELRMDAVYVVRSRVRLASGCVYYARVRPVEWDAEEGAFRFEVVRNPNCNDRALTPPD